MIVEWMVLREGWVEEVGVLEGRWCREFEGFWGEVIVDMVVGLRVKGG